MCINEPRPFVCLLLSEHGKLDRHFKCALGTWNESGDGEKIDCVLSRRDSNSAVSLLCVIDRVSIFRIKSSSQLDVVSFSTIVFADSQSHCSKCHFLSFLQAPVETYLLFFLHKSSFAWTWQIFSLVNCV